MPQASRVDRAKLARETHSKMPSILASDKRASAGLSSSRLLRPLKDVPEAKESDNPPKITVIASDTFEAARSYLPLKAAVLNMCSPLRPGGGVMTGASSQEESLCLRSTLYPSLKEEYYRLPDDAVVFSPDVMVFRNEELEEVKKRERFYVDVISCAALRGPEVEGDKYVDEKDREVMMGKIRGIFRTAADMGADVLVLGAFGCGAYGNPVEEVAEMFKKVIFGTKRKKGEAMGGIGEIVFAIKPVGSTGRKNLKVFTEAFRIVRE